VAVTIRKMTDGEFERFFRWSMEQHAQELMEGSHLSREAAVREAQEELSRMLPDGLHTNGNYLMTILEANSEENAGFIWTIHEETAGRKQSFLCDFAVWEEKRRKGYASCALHLAETMTAEALCRESVLFVADWNEPAKALYEKCGYRFLRKQEQGQYMIKQLAQPQE